MAQELRLTFRVLTPLFLGGADQESPELRAPAFKGLLRFWYRALDPDFCKHEPALFGGTSEGIGQSPFLLRVDPDPPPRLAWSNMDADRFNRGSGRDTRNGLVYLGFPFRMRDNDRQAIRPGHTFTVRNLIPSALSADNERALRLRRSLTAAWWLLGHFGAIGSRSRRGFGSLSLEAWTTRQQVWPEPAQLPRAAETAESENWPELAQLPLAAGTTDASACRVALHKGLATLRAWFSPDKWPTGKQAPEHPHLGSAFRFKLLDNAWPVAEWAAALAAMGSDMQEFRLRRAPDYQAVKDHLLAQDRAGGRPLRSSPTRASFGLPLTFRYSSIRGRTAQFVPYDEYNRTTFERQGSLLLMRQLAIGDGLHPLYARMDGAVPGVTPLAALRRSARPLAPAPANAMDEFFDSLPSEGG
jgi:CRISPR-associated protein Cmr1